jgi:hypothetical protein
MKWTVFTVAMLSILACNSNESSEVIKLNEGEKWEVNAEMRPFIDQGNVILEAYIASGASDYQSLAKDLKTQNSELISSCTMKGESHDELHKWLHPHIGLVEKLANSENEATANDYVKELKTSFGTYNTYFK